MKINARRKSEKIKRGDVYYVDLGDGVGSEVKKIRPCVVVQNNIGNKFSPTTIIVPITHRTRNSTQPTQVILSDDLVFGDVDGVILAEQLRIIDKTRIKERIGYLTVKGLAALNKAMQVSIGV